MDSTNSADFGIENDKINRRSFLAKSIGYTTAGLSLLTLPGILTETLAANEGKSKEEIYKALEEKVEKSYPVYHSCSQTAFAALNDQFGLNADQTVTAIKLFAGGIAGKGETCGAVTGALLAIGFYFDVIKKDNANPRASMQYGGMFFDKFTKEFESTRCKEVMKHQYGKYIDYSNPDDLKILGKPENQGKCLDVMKTATHIVADIILENS